MGSRAIPSARRRHDSAVVRSAHPCCDLRRRSRDPMRIPRARSRHVAPRDGVDPADDRSRGRIRDGSDGASRRGAPGRAQRTSARVRDARTPGRRVWLWLGDGYRGVRPRSLVGTRPGAEMSDPVTAVRWDGEALYLLDQRRLPETVHVDRYTRSADVRDAIAELRVRGAPAIGIAAAYGLVLGLTRSKHDSAADFGDALRSEADTLRSARPTAVNLAWALDRVKNAAERALVGASDPQAAYLAMRAEAEAIHEEDRAMCRAIGEHGVHLIRPGCGVLTHCNAGALAVSELGTATAPLYLAHSRAVPFRVFACETRPLLQGARLTAWELARAGVDVTVVCDNAAAQLMAAREIDLVIVGTDRVTRNGDVVNKIGTSALAVLAKHFGIPFYVACPSSTFDPSTATGADVTIEQRASIEVTELAGRRIVPHGVKVRNPAFDVTPSALVTGLITDRGLLATRR